MSEPDAAKDEARKFRENEYVFVYNTGGRFWNAAEGEYLWHGMILRVVRDDPDPDRCVYDVWGPGGEQSSELPGACLSRTTRPRPPRPEESPPPPDSPDPWDEPVGRADLPARVGAAVAGMNAPEGRARRAAKAAVDYLLPAWKYLSAPDNAVPFTPRVMAADLRRVADFLGRVAENLVPRPPAPDPETDVPADVPADDD